MPKLSGITKTTGMWQSTMWHETCLTENIRCCWRITYIWGSGNTV